jgi:hypothetical protein
LSWCSPLLPLTVHARPAQEKLAAELASYFQLRDTAAAREAEVEAAKERLRVAGTVEQRQMEQTQQAVDRLREENERRCGEVNGELAMLATEAKELRRNLAFLKVERTAIRTTLGQVSLVALKQEVHLLISCLQFKMPYLCRNEIPHTSHHKVGIFQCHCWTASFANDQESERFCMA